jgi:hypothetical protein
MCEAIRNTLSWLTLGVVGVILDDQPDLAAVDAALLVDLVHAQLQAVARCLAEWGHRAGQVLDRANDDLVLAHALRRLGEHSGRRQLQQHTCRGRRDETLHSANRTHHGSAISRWIE